MKEIIGRYKEFERLDRCMNDIDSQLIIVYGRRRVGKTYLINKYFQNKYAFKLTGEYKENKTVQLNNFMQELKRKSQKELKKAKNWHEAFAYLREYIETLSNDEKQVFFIDEMPWLQTHKSDFLSAFEFFWNDYASAKQNIVFVVSGSSTSWMVNKLLKNKGGLYNRHAARINLEPFNLSETKEYLENKGIMWSLYDIVNLYMITGGIPYYLSKLNPRLSLNQNIDELFFKENCELKDEFLSLYNTLFENNKRYIKIASILSSKRGGLTRTELIKSLDCEDNGDISDILQNLIDSGFVKIRKIYGTSKKNIKYYLSDYYSNFYFKFLSNGKKDENYWQNSYQDNKRKIWEGLTFENVCIDHINQIKQKLGISGVLTDETVWSISTNDELGVNGAQIDLLIERKDRVINICEIKFVSEEFIINKEYDLNLRNKINSFRVSTKTKYTLQLTLITTYGVKNNIYSNIVNNSITLNDLFKEKI